MRRFLLTLVVVTLTAPAASAQEAREQTLADIRQELSVLFVEIQKLKRELSTTGSAGQLVSGGSMLDRVNAIEGELQRLTSKTENLEYRIDRVVQDGTNRIGDLEFRLVELEGGDVSQLGETTTLGGVASDAPPQPVSEPAEDAPQMAVGEEADFRRAEQALASEQYSDAAALFDAFGEAYPGSPLAGQARLMKGQALEGTGEMTQAARSYLDTFSADPDGPVAADALFHLGKALGRLNQLEEACVALGEVEERFPGSQSVAKAQTEMSSLGCP